jgi:hypothetical protein
MKFFATSESYKDISKKLVTAQNAIAAELEPFLKDKNYGICCPPEIYNAGFFKEIKKYTKNETDVELRLKIDYTSMLEAEEEKVFALLCESILRGIDIAEHELKISDFDFGAFRKDVTNLFKKEGWLE